MIYMTCQAIFSLKIINEKKKKENQNLSAAVVICTLIFSMQNKISSRRHIEIVFLFSQKTGFDVSCKLSPVETICMKCQILFYLKNKKKKILQVCHLLCGKD